MLRSFDPVKNEHPVQWLLANRDKAKYGPLHDWMKELMEKDLPSPENFLMPELGVVQNNQKPPLVWIKNLNSLNIFIP